MIDFIISVTGSIVKRSFVVVENGAMTKAAAVKGMAVQAFQPVTSDTPVAKATLHKTPGGPPAKARGARPAAAAVKAQTVAELQNAIADASGLPPKEAKRFLEALRKVAAQSLRETNVFKIHNIVLIRIKETPARHASVKVMFGKEVAVPAKPAGRKMSALAMKPLQDDVKRTSET